MWVIHTKICYTIVSMKNERTLLTLGAIFAVVAIIFVALDVRIPGIKSEEVVCTTDAKICPDGSAVGRSGPRCEFAPCPSVSSSPTTSTERTTATLNQTIALQGIMITPMRVVQDSRCPVDVQCIQAGTVQLSVQLQQGNDVQVLTLTLGGKMEFAGKLVELVAVRPSPNSKKSILASEYQFDFLVSDVSASNR